MILYRINNFCRIIVIDDKVIIKIDKNKITLTLDRNTIEFFKTVLDEEVFDQSLINKFNINPLLFNFFLCNDVFIQHLNDGKESLIFDKFIYNPLYGIDLSYDQLVELHKLIEKGLSPLLNFSKFEQLNSDVNALDLNLSTTDFSKLQTIRLVIDSNNGVKTDIKSIIKTVFSKREIKQIFDVDKSYYYYGSAGGTFTVFPVIITKENEIIVYDKHNELFYTCYIDNIYNNIINDCLLKQDFKLDAYDNIIVLISDIGNIFKKYGNRGYRYVFLETGEISFIFRMLCGKFDFPHVEVQGFKEEPLYDLLNSLDIFKNKYLVSHIILLNSNKYVYN